MNRQEINNLEDLKVFAQNTVQEIKTPQLFLIQGPLGVGKTQYVRFASEELGVLKKDICSPSFSLIEVYTTPKAKISHIDLFRLQDKQDLESSGVWDVFLDSEIVFVEWADRLEVSWPSHWNKLILFFEFSKDENSRLVKWKKEGQLSS